MEERFLKMIPKECGICKRKDGLLRCGGCSTYYYCSREHQVADRRTDKGTCKQIKDAKESMDAGEARLLAQNPNYKETFPGNLWQPIFGRLYLYTVYHYGETLLRSWRQQGIEDGLDVFLRLLQLNHADHQSVSDLVAPLYIRLGRDQEAYDFLKYWGLHFRGLLQPEQPFLGVKNADPYEGVELWANSESMPLAQAAIVMLIKIRLMTGLQSVKRMKEWKASKGENVAAMSGREVLDWLHDDLRPFCGDIFERDPDVLGNDALLDEKHSMVAEQIGTLFKAIGDYNPLYWASMLGPEEEDFASQKTGIHPPRIPRRGEIGLCADLLGVVRD
jgi:hypothetical protein